MTSLVLSTFSGMGALDEGFRREGFCVVSAGDLVFSGLYDIRGFHPPAGKFDGVIGGPPCQTFSALANLVRAKGLEPSFGNLIPEFVRCVEEAAPAWFLMENVPGVPFESWPRPAGYAVASFELDNWASLGEEQSRRRRFWFGQRGEKVAELRRWIEFATEVPAEYALALNCAHDHLDGAEKIARRRAATSCDGRRGHREGRSKKAAVLGRHHGAVGAVDGRAGSDARYSLEEMLELQGIPKDVFDHSPLTVQGKRKLVGNAVPLPMARALAKAVREATQ